MNLDEQISVFDPSSLYPTVVSLLDSIYPRPETSFVLTKRMIDQLVKRLNRKTLGIKI